jgi:phosphatidylserine decarboxylase
MDPAAFVSPADSKRTVLPITRDGRFTLKQTPYTVTSLLRDEALAAEYEGGWALIFRLCVDDYHRYCYAFDAEKGENVVIPGRLHTVNPIANDFFPIYKENAREYTILRTEKFGDVIAMEVGALLVGKIVNHHGAATVRRGQEKGYFQFGGSTVVLLLKKDTAVLDSDILENSRQGIETVVKFGEKIGAAK